MVLGLGTGVTFHVVLNHYGFRFWGLGLRLGWQIGSELRI